MKVRVLCIPILFLAHVAMSCIWISGTKYNGAHVTTGPSAGDRLRYSIEKDTKPDGVMMEAELRGARAFDDRSNYSVALMYLGRNSEAVELLRQLEKEQPGTYFIAANLGTAFELAGANEDALYWITEGIRRNPESHKGTEWLHVKILEAKIAREKDPDYFKKHSVLDLHPESIGDKIVTGNRSFSRSEVADAIHYQLQERLRFVKPPDPAVASLLFDYAAIDAVTGTLESAEGVLDMAIQYGYPSEQVQPLQKLFHRRILWRKTKQYGTYVGIGSAALFGLYVLYKRGIFVISSRDLKR